MDEQPTTRIPSQGRKLHYQFPLPNRDLRAKELILYIAHKCADDPKFSKIKLFKILFYSDFESFGRYRQPITGMPYRKAPLGPAPALFDRLESEMLRDRQITILTRRVYDYSSQRLFPLTEPTFEFLSARDIAVVEGWIQYFWGWTAKRVSQYSHGKAWSVAGNSELIPYESVYLSDEPATFEDVDRAKELAEKYGWKV
jgi:antitoxin SocA-like protein